MKFYRYPSLYNLSESTYQVFSELKIFQLNKPDSLRHPLFERIPPASPICVATEKIHGCNIQIHFCDDGSYRFGSRSQYVDNDFLGLNLPLLLKDVFYSSKMLFQEFVKINPCVKEMTVYGELFGGIYYGKVAPFSTAVQKGINYIPYNEITLFDVAIHYEDSQGELSTYYLPYGGILDYYRHFQNRNGQPLSIYLPPIVRIGTWQEMLGTNNSFESYIPYTLLPATEQSPLIGNTCEGIVIRPMYGDIYHKGNRIIIKSKNDKWSERRNNGNWKKNNKPEYDHPLRKTLEQYLSTNRVINILSHHKQGDEFFSKKDIGFLSGLLAKDILEEAIRDGIVPEDWKQNDKLKPLGKWLSQRSENYLTELLKEVSIKLS
jgi:Rnl2 family RNA ligase